MRRSPETDGALLAAPIGLYAGWLTAAASVSLGVVATGWGLPPGPVGWGWIALVLTLAVAALVGGRKVRLAYTAALLWAIVALWVANNDTLLGSGALGIAVGLAVSAAGRTSRYGARP